MITVRPVDASSDDDLALGARLMTEMWQEALGPTEPPTEVAEMVAWLRHVAADAEVLGWFALDGDDAVGFAVLETRTGRGNDHLAWVTDLWVRPSERRRGVGRLLLDEAVAAAKARGRTQLSHGHQVPHAGAEGFCDALGCTVELADDQNRVATADLDRAMLESWAASVPEGYSVVSFDIPCPDDLLDAFVRVQDVMNTAPRAESENPSIVTADQVRDSERRLAARGSDHWRVAVRHDATGELVGYTELVLDPYKAWLGRQGDTAVAEAHRGHGLGRVLKAVNALRLLDERPEVTHIETWNASSNEHMLAINHAMGFRCVSQWRSVELCI